MVLYIIIKNVNVNIGKMVNIRNIVKTMQQYLMK